MLALEVQKKLGDLALDISFESGGPVTGLFGPSGAGKTTLVQVIAGLARPDRGRVALGDTILFDSRQQIDVPA
ncbi:MAG: ATP-binding cassette domain-containing protein, partial [Pseudorhodoplanes sp.]